MKAFLENCSFCLALDGPLRYDVGGESAKVLRKCGRVETFLKAFQHLSET